MQAKNVTIVVILNILYVSVGGWNVKRVGFRYVLQATHAQKTRGNYTDFRMGLQPFIRRGCKYQNCFLTYNASYFQNIRNFDVILFDAKQINMQTLMVPKKRSQYQKYIFMSTESLANLHLDPKLFDGFFNWTWTYRLDSDIPLNNIIIRNAIGEIIGPRQDMKWRNIKQMKPTSDYVKTKLANKTIAAAWIVSDCEKNSKSGEFVQNLSRELDAYGERIDVYGRCGFLECPRKGANESCYSMIERDYYFYLAFENSFSEDYVTEKVLIALQHFAVPIVYGGANYSRFLPKGSYLDANVLGPTSLALKMVNIIRNKYSYYRFFKWHRYYSFHHRRESPETNPYCVFCNALNDNDRMNETSIYSNFSLWWNGTQQINITEPESATEIKEKTSRHILKDFLSEVFDYMVKGYLKVLL